MVQSSDRLSQRTVAVIHFDADWNVGGRPLVRAAMLEGARVFGDRVNFGEVDCDREGELAKSIPVLNVPCVVYYQGGRRVATVIGIGQNARGARGATIAGRTDWV